MVTVCQLHRVAEWEASQPAGKAQKGGKGMLFVLQDNWRPKSLAAAPWGFYCRGEQQWVIEIGEKHLELRSEKLAWLDDWAEHLASE